MTLRKLLLLALALLVSPLTVFAQSSGAVTYYIDPLTLTFILLVVGVVVALLIYAMTQIGNSNVLQTYVNADVAIEQKMTDAYVRLVDSTVNFQNQIASAFQTQTQADIQFKNSVLNLLYLKEVMSMVNPRSLDDVARATALATSLARNPQLETAGSTK